MRIGEHEISWLLLGAAIGSFVTYWHVTKEKRFISNVRKDMRLLAPYHQLKQGQRHKVEFAQEELADDRRILEIYRWTQRLKDRQPPIPGIKKIDPARLVAEVIICELLGLTTNDALQALLNFKTLDELQTLRPKNLN